MADTNNDWLAIARKHGYAFPGARMEAFVTDLLAARRAVPAQASAPAAAWVVQHNGKTVAADTLSQCMIAARKLRTPEEEAIAASNLAAAIAADQAEEEAERAATPAAVKPTITTEEMAALNRFCECCEDFDSGGYDVPKAMMKRLACIGLVRACGFGRYETTLFGDAMRAASQSPSQGAMDAGSEASADKLALTEGQMQTLQRAAEALEGCDYEDTAGDLRAIIATLKGQQ